MILLDFEGIVRRALARKMVYVTTYDTSYPWGRLSQPRSWEGLIRKVKTLQKHGKKWNQPIWVDGTSTTNLWKSLTFSLAPSSASSVPFPIGGGAWRKPSKLFNTLGPVRMFVGEQPLLSYVMRPMSFGTQAAFAAWVERYWDSIFQAKMYPTNNSIVVPLGTPLADDCIRTMQNSYVREYSRETRASVRRLRGEIARHEARIQSLEEELTAVSSTDLVSVINDISKMPFVLGVELRQNRLHVRMMPTMCRWTWNRDYWPYVEDSSTLSRAPDLVLSDAHLTLGMGRPYINFRHSVDMHPHRNCWGDYEEPIDTALREMNHAKVVLLVQEWRRRHGSGSYALSPTREMVVNYTYQWLEWVGRVYRNGSVTVDDDGLLVEMPSYFYPQGPLWFPSFSTRISGNNGHLIRAGTSHAYSPSLNVLDRLMPVPPVRYRRVA